MNEFNHIVMKGYPVEKLPEELRRGLENVLTVTVTIVPELPSEERRPLRSFLGAGKGVYTEEEAVGFIRKLRDE
jgi:hypothetical protein